MSHQSNQIHESHSIMEINSPFEYLNLTDASEAEREILRNMLFKSTDELFFQYLTPSIQLNLLQYENNLIKEIQPTIQHHNNNNNNRDYYQQSQIQYQQQILQQFYINQQIPQQIGQINYPMYYYNQPQHQQQQYIDIKGKFKRNNNRNRRNEDFGYYQQQQSINYPIYFNPMAQTVTNMTGPPLIMPANHSQHIYQYIYPIVEQQQQQQQHVRNEKLENKNEKLMNNDEKLNPLDEINIKIVENIQIFNSNRNNEKNILMKKYIERVQCKETTDDIDMVITTDDIDMTTTTDDIDMTTTTYEIDEITTVINEKLKITNEIDKTIIIEKYVDLTTIDEFIYPTTTIIKTTTIEKQPDQTTTIITIEKQPDQITTEKQLDQTIEKQQDQTTTEKQQDQTTIEEQQGQTTTTEEQQGQTTTIEKQPNQITTIEKQPGQTTTTKIEKQPNQTTTTTTNDIVLKILPKNKNNDILYTTIKKNRSWASIATPKLLSTDMIINGIDEYNNLIMKKKKKINNEEIDLITIEFGKFLINYIQNHHTISLTPRGLSNQNNFCYINATLQCLIACPPFVNLFRSMKDIIGEKSCISTPIIQSMYNFIDEFEPITRLIQNRHKKTDTFYIGNNLEAVGIRQMLGLLDGVTFKVEGRQEDAEEFLSHLLNGIHDEMIKVINETSRTTTTKLLNGEEYEEDNMMDTDDWQVMGPKNKGSLTRKTFINHTPISELFIGQMCSSLNKMGGLKSTTLQPFFTLQLDIQDDTITTVRAALESITIREEINFITNSGPIEAIKQTSFDTLPIILILHLKRFVYDKSVNKIIKLDKIVDFNIDLEISRDLLSSNSRNKYTLKQRQYKLFAVIYHDGDCANKGHYIADTFHPSGGSLWGQFGWIRYDDTIVNGIDENQLFHHHHNQQRQRRLVPYLLFYRRCDMITTSTNNSKEIKR